MEERNNLNEIKKLEPEKRVAKLKDFIEKNKEELKQAEILLKFAEQEFSEIIEDKKIEKEKESLEQTVKNEKVLEKKGEQYDIKYLSKEPAYEMQQKVSSLYNNIIDRVKKGYDITEDQRTQLYAMRDALEEKTESISSGTYNPSEDAREKLDAAGNMIKKLLGGYVN